jgi:hypothetical protein
MPSIEVVGICRVEKAVKSMAVLDPDKRVGDYLRQGGYLFLSRKAGAAGADAASR